MFPDEEHDFFFNWLKKIKRRKQILFEKYTNHTNFNLIHLQKNKNQLFNIFVASFEYNSPKVTRKNQI